MPGPLGIPELGILRGGSHDRHVRLLAGVIRNYNDGLGWRLIDDGLHPAIGITDVDSLSNTAQIRVNYPDLFSDIAGTPRTGTLIAVPDETLAQAGFFCGASVAPSFADIKLGRNGALADYLSYDGAAWVWASGGRFTVSDQTSNTLTITHDAVISAEKDAIGLTRRGNGPIPVISPDSGYGSTTNFKIDWLDPTTGQKLTTPTTAMKAAISRSHIGIPVVPGDVHIGVYPFSNIWLFGVHQVAA